MISDTSKEMYDYLSYLSVEEKEELKKEMNTGKVNKGFVLSLKAKSVILPFLSLKQDEVDPYLFFYDEDIDSPGRSIFHELGAYYIMDPSSDVVIKNLPAVKNELVLDMCAAPGGKTISYAMRNKDAVIIANDISYSRAFELKKNVERMGLANVIVTSLPPSYFIKNFSSVFSVVILDAPCSGTGMFRKDEDVKRDWSIEKTRRLLPIQNDLIEIGYQLLKKGGYLAYSTCSFLKEEDDDISSAFKKRHPDMCSVKLISEEGFFFGEDGSVYLLPSRYKKGEGHYISLMRKAGDEKRFFSYKKCEYDKILELYKADYKNQMCALPFFDDLFFSLDNVLKMGVTITSDEKYPKCIYHHSLSHYLSSDKSIKLNYDEAIRCVNGEELENRFKHEDGLVLLSYNGLNISFGKVVKNRIKNYYPKWLRKKIKE